MSKIIRIHNGDYKIIVTDGSNITLDASEINVLGELRINETPLGRAIFKTVPTTSTSPGAEGDLAFDSSYLYICVGPDMWRRIALSAW